MKKPEMQKTSLGEFPIHDPNSCLFNIYSSISNLAHSAQIELTVLKDKLRTIQALIGQAALDLETKVIKKRSKLRGGKMGGTIKPKGNL